MKFREIKRTVPVAHERDGITHTITRTVTERVPVPPRDLDSVALKGAAGLVLGLTLVAVAWSTVSIGSLLRGGVGYAAAGLFDVAWAVCLLLEWLARFDPAKRKFAHGMGWALVGITMGAIAWHGLELDSWPLAVVGAVVSLVAKLLWLAVFKHIDRPLSDEDRQWVAAEMSRANAQLAIAGVRRQAARAEARAAAELLAAEYERQGWPTDPAQARPVTAAEDAHERLTEAAARRRAIASTPGAAPEDHERARRALDDALDAYAAVPSEAPVPEPVAAPGTREDSRAQAAPTQVSALPAPGTARTDEPEEPEPYRVPPQAPRSMAAGVRELRAAKVADPEVMAARLSALMGKDVPVSSVKREIRRQTAAEAKAADDGGTGAYL